MALAIILLVLAALLDLLLSRFHVIGISGGPAWLISLALLAGMLGAIGWAARNRLDGVLIDRDNRISLSRLQLILWTVLLIGALQAAGIFNSVLAFPWPVDKPVMKGPLDIIVPPEIWALLGLGSFTAVAAPTIKNRFRTRAALPQTVADTICDGIQKDGKLKERGSFEGQVYRNATSDEARWLNLVMGDYEGAAYVDISKVQHLALTLLLVLVYGMALYQALDRALPFADPISSFPNISPGFLSLLGISHAAYLADKAGGQS